MNLCHWRSPTRTDQISTETVTQIVPSLESTHHVPERLFSPSVKHEPCDETVPNVLQVSNAIYKNEFPYTKRVFRLFLRIPEPHELKGNVRQRSNYWTFFIMWQKIWNVFEYLQKHNFSEKCGALLLWLWIVLTQFDYCCLHSSLFFAPSGLELLAVLYKVFSN